YSGFGAELPLVTRMIVTTSEFIRGNVFLILITIAVAAFALLGWIRPPGQKAKFDHLILGLPGLGPIASKFSTSQMARTLATLLGGGLPLVNALDIASKSIGNQFMASELEVV